MTWYVVYVAGEDRMERYKAFETFEEAKKCADNYRRFNKGSIWVYKETSDQVYSC